MNAVSLPLPEDAAGRLNGLDLRLCGMCVTDDRGISATKAASETVRMSV